MKGYVYFIQAGIDGPIKIGFSKTDPSRRMGQLQAGCPWELRLLGFIPGTKFDEKLLQEKFSQFNIRREWFRPEIDIGKILSPGFVWPTPESMIDRAILLAGSVTNLSRATGVHQPIISAARSSGETPKRIRQFLASAESAA